MPSSTLSSLTPLVTLCEERKLPLTDRALKRFEHYLELLLRFNKSMNLIGPMQAEGIVEELLCDSLMPAAARAPKGSILDIGSGAGLPGIPLKILYPELPITLVEPRKKRASFLKIVIKKLALRDIEILNARLEHVSDLGHDYVISKAFQPPLTWIETAKEICAPEGVIVCMTRAIEQPALDARALILGLERVVAMPSAITTHDGIDDRMIYIYQSASP